MKKILTILTLTIALAMQVNANVVFHNNVYDAQKKP